MPGGQSGLPSRALGGGLGFEKFSGRNRKYTYDNFDSLPTFQKSTGNGAATGSTGDLNLLRTSQATYEFHIKGTQTIIVPVYDAVNGLGLDFGQDQTAADGHETTFGTNIVTALGTRSKHGYQIGGVGGETKRFFAQFTFKPADTSGIAEGFFGFIKMGAYQTALASYNEYAGISLNSSGTSAKVNIKTQLAGGGNVTTDTTQTLADNVVMTIRVEVDPLTRTARILAGQGLTQAAIDAGQVPAPTVTVTNFQFTSGVIVRPAFFFLQAADLCDNLFYQNFQAGYIPTRGD